jgi:hypothetical protein
MTCNNPNAGKISCNPTRTKALLSILSVPLCCASTDFMVGRAHVQGHLSNFQRIQCFPMLVPNRNRAKSTVDENSAIRKKEGRK